MSPSAKLNKTLKPTASQRGKRYEKLAEEYLINKGFRILERNWRFGRKEIDLIALKEKTIIFVEVKGCRTGQFGHPTGRVDRRKRQNLIGAAEKFIIEKNITDSDFRFDLITFLGGNLEYYRDAFPGNEE
ncbi:MAG: YraN family protein [candidate division Zixibacteria bacterium]|nr:YraN family protein [candidate division Zixibacteria bacterium]